MIKVGFDISQIIHPGGVAGYTKNLASELQKNPELEMIFFFSALRKSYRGGLKNVKKFRLPPSLFEVLFNRIRNVGIEKFIGPLDIYHSSDWVQPPSKAKKVTTYHDVIPLKYPQWSNPKIVAVHKRRLKIVQREIDKVIAVSNSTKNDLMEMTGLKNDQIKVIYEGVSGIFKPASGKEIAEFKKKYSLPGEFILAIGGTGERKNLKRIKQAAKDYNLVTTFEDITVSDEELPVLYSSARCLVYTTLYEGFGLPILESMACGTPVITSDVSSMPEIAGQAALLVNPADEEEIKKSIRRILNDKDLNSELTEKGFRRAKEFTWQKTAAETFQVYKNLMK
ncbi:MAG TPA: glycosyltransferase family 1 protein [Patescibacteria group bacterium]|nr:glycosyltransferase family 1 protein [Patescibacteria group bacterium]